MTDVADASRSVVSMREVCLRFGKTYALDGCSFDVARGSVTALVGRNGAGKSTLMSVAVGLLTPQSGSVSVLGRSPGHTGISPGLSYLAQHKPLYGKFTVAEMLRFGQRTNAQWDNAYAGRLVSEADVPMRAKIRSLSPGQRARIAVALALGRRPDVVLLDEPLADLDPVARRSVAQTLMRDAAQHGTTVVLSSHILVELTDVADQLLLLDRGRIRLTGSLDDLLDDHYLLTGTGDPQHAIGQGAIIESRAGTRTTTHLVHGPRPPHHGDWLLEQPTIDEIVLAHLAEQKEERA
ncbi:ABC transporter ATP-binding protein [Rhodococcus tibetensis]|uniref:ABC transporter ATP-binding protein n=1 Tax=Rhodococcus tibetensis TaxID=2965064 RepID=A0ABT1QKA8_9NOCA|nr:ABC transporter ATP-binding protein [Rhodococcus sp. FXJ9.536]MCQ4122729.1 ABC transporter ATP-binding protein [Rhodococcus sp. FXJ9.536]